MKNLIQLQYLTRETLLEANAEAVQSEFSSYCRQEALEQHLRVGYKYPVTGSSYDPDGNMVCRILVGPEDAIYVALTQVRYHSLPTVPVDMAVVNAMAEASESSKH